MIFPASERSEGGGAYGDAVLGTLPGRDGTPSPRGTSPVDNHIAHR